MGIPSTWTQDNTHTHTHTHTQTNLTKDKCSTRLLYCTFDLNNHIKQKYAKFSRLTTFSKHELPDGWQAGRDRWRWDEWNIAVTCTLHTEMATEWNVMKCVNLTSFHCKISLSLTHTHTHTHTQHDVRNIVLSCPVRKVTNDTQTAHLSTVRLHKQYVTGCP
jgi:hypothetical protein